MSRGNPNPKPGPGRPKGVPNKLTISMKDMVQATLEGLGGAAGMIEWARDNQTEFYKIAARLIPTDIKATVTKTDFVVNILGHEHRSSSPQLYAPPETIDGVSELVD